MFIQAPLYTQLLCPTLQGTNSSAENLRASNWIVKFIKMYTEMGSISRRHIRSCYRKRSKFVSPNNNYSVRRCKKYVSEKLLNAAHNLLAELWLLKSSVQPCLHMHTEGPLLICWTSSTEQLKQGLQRPSSQAIEGSTIATLLQRLLVRFTPAIVPNKSHPLLIMTQQWNGYEAIKFDAKLEITNLTCQF